MSVIFAVTHTNGRELPGMYRGEREDVLKWLLGQKSWTGMEVCDEGAQKYFSVGEFVNTHMPSEIKAEIVENQAEAVNHPSHYNQYEGLEIIDLVRQMNFNRGNAVKYVTRAGFKDSDKEVEDLEKAIFYIQDEIDWIKRKRV